MAYNFKHINPSTDDWKRIESAYDSTCFQTRRWCTYLRVIGRKPLILSVVDEHGAAIGYFIGEKLFCMVFAPSMGTGTYTQGLVLLEKTTEEQRIAIYQSIADWLFKNRVAFYLRVDDWHLRRDYEAWMPEKSFHHELLDERRIAYGVRPTLHLDLRKTEEELWAGCHYKSCKYSVNKARKLGLKVRVVDDRNGIDAFVRNHYDQLVDVCAHKGLKPKRSQSRERMKSLCESLFPDRVLMLEVVGTDEKQNVQSMASGIFCIDKGECSYWTGASYRRCQKYCPNELLVWEAVRMLRERGAGDLNFCGMASYKLKFGTIYAYVPRIVFSKWEWLNLAFLKKNVYDAARMKVTNIYKRIKP